MPLIDLTYFTGQCHIANIASPPIAENVDYFTNLYETELLKKILGLDLYLDFKAGLLEAIIDQKWLDLRDGKIFQIDGKSYEWKGFRNDRKISPIANYVYYHYKIDKIHHTVGAGHLRPEVENGQIVSPINELVRIWNDMNGMLFEFNRFMKNHPDLYPNWRPSGNFSKINTFNF